MKKNLKKLTALAFVFTMAAMTALDTQFSDAINSMWLFWRDISASMAAATSLSTAFTSSNEYIVRSSSFSGALTLIVFLSRTFVFFICSIILKRSGKSKYFFAKYYSSYIRQPVCRCQITLCLFMSILVYFSEYTTHSDTFSL